jgi:hypothetical protein
MSAAGTSLIVFVLLITAAVVGSSLRKVVPTQHLGGESWSMVSVGVGFISTMAAIALGLLVASAKNSYDAKNTELQEAAAKVLVLDRTLREYGPETLNVRAMVRNLLRANYNMLWVKQKAFTSGTDDAASSPSVYGYEQVDQSLRALSPANETQRALQTRALQIVEQIGQMRWLLVAQSTEGVSLPLLIALVSWLAVIAGCAGLFSPRNATVFAVAALCAVAVSGTVFLIMSMYDPFGGVLSLSRGPLLKALQVMGQP